MLKHITTFMNVDGIDIKDIEICKDSLREVVCLPPVKSVEINDWWEYDGIEPDLSAPLLASRDVKLNLAGIGKYHNIGNFIERLSENSSYHTFNIAERNFNYRLESMSDFRQDGFSSFTLTLKDDSISTRGDIRYVKPNANDNSDYFGDIDGIDLRKYGIAILDGTIKSIKRAPETKGNLSQDFKTFDGTCYDGRVVRFKSKDIVLKCMMRANNYEDFWQQRDNLLHDLIYRGEHVLYVNETEEELPFYYKSCSSVEFMEDPIWWIFDLTLCVMSERPKTEVFAIGDSERLLITNDDKMILI